MFAWKKTPKLLGMTATFLAVIVLLSAPAIAMADAADNIPLSRHPLLTMPLGIIFVLAALILTVGGARSAKSQRRRKRYGPFHGSLGGTAGRSAAQIRSEFKSRLPCFMQPFMTWLMGRPYPGQKPFVPVKHWSLAVLTYMAIWVSGIASACWAISTGGIALFTLPVSLLLTVCGARALQVHICHQLAIAAEPVPRLSQLSKRITWPWQATAKIALNAQGFVKLDGSQFQGPSFPPTGLSELAEHFQQLSVDSYAPDKNRFRGLRRFTLLEYGDLILIPRPKESCVYTQSLGLNEEVGGVIRKFDPLPDEIANSTFLRNLILHDFDLCDFSPLQRTTPFDVGVHFIRMYAKPGVPGVSVPDCLHKDGEPYTFVHLMGRKNVSGGESVVADNKKQILLETRLLQPLDMLGVKDSLVYHQARRVEVAADASEGYRDVILIDFSPMVAIVEG